MIKLRGISGWVLGSVCAVLPACGNTSGGGSNSNGGSGTVAAGGSELAGGAAGAASSLGGSAGTGAGGMAGAVASGGDAGASEVGAAGEGGASNENAGTGGIGGSSAGSAGTLGNGGAGGAGPQAHSSKLDVLLVIDNSVSMSDKQDALEATLPAFIERLTNPRCVDANHKPVAVQPVSASEPCTTGTREFTATDIHLGVISTSLGSHGGSVCSAPVAGDPLATLDDQGHLLGKLRPGLSTWQNSGFLSWDPRGITGSSSVAALTSNLTAQIIAAGDDGCGFEAPLEAMYRFLIDPEPPATVSKVGGQTLRQGIDSELLAERAAFLRPDSAVAVLALSDENDCSIRDDGVGWFVGASSHMPKATAACATDPNDPCCRSCAQNESAPPAGCASLANDPVCAGAPAGSYNTWDNLHDSLNLRCFQQHQRFGFDLLYPTTRYSAGLSALMIPNNAGTLVKNPLFYDKSGVQTRSPTLVTFSAMVGVPWQDLATTESLAGGKLQYLDAAALSAQGRWPLFLGNPRTFVDAQDPLMIESSAPRSGVQPLINAPLAPATSTNPQQNPINGHEQNIPDLADLEYACIFPLLSPKSCTPGDLGCDCSADKSGDASAVTAANSPVCQPPGGGPAGTTQYYAKAYPGLRELDVVRDLGERGVPTSICPKTLANPSDADFGYAPAFDALLRRVAAGLN